MIDANHQINDKKIRWQYIAQIFISFIVLKAFTCELQLKSIISFENDKVPKIHNLEKLFYKLKGKSQKNKRNCNKTILR